MPLIEDQFEDTLVIARPDMPAVLVVAGNSGYVLPVVCTAAHHPAEVAPIRAAILEQLQLDTVVRACRQVSVADGVVRRVLEVESLSTSAALHWVGEGDLASVDASQRSLLRDWFRRSAAVPDTANGRDWMAPGWWARATAWIASNVEATGLGRVQAIEQIRAWEFSCVVRVQTDMAELFFKALPLAYAAEPGLAHHLAHGATAFVPEVLAIHEHERWLLMRACRGRCLESGAPLGAWERAAASYAELQLASTRELAELRALGCRERGPRELRALLGPLLSDESALLTRTEHGLTAAEVSRLRQLLPSFEAACDELAASGLPLALEHGDLWSSNVYVGDEDIAFIDWTDACLSHPFFSLTPLLQSASWDPYLTNVPDARRRIEDAYLAHWTAYASPERLRRAMALARPLAAIHIAITYWRDIPQPHQQWWMARTIPFFVRMALTQWDASGD